MLCSWMPPSHRLILRFDEPVHPSYFSFSVLVLVTSKNNTPLVIDPVKVIIIIIHVT
jgi:hypothetical protein